MNVICKSFSLWYKTKTREREREGNKDRERQRKRERKKSVSLIDIVLQVPKLTFKWTNICLHKDRGKKRRNNSKNESQITGTENEMNGVSSLMTTLIWQRSNLFLSDVYSRRRGVATATWPRLKFDVDCWFWENQFLWWDQEYDRERERESR